jgi:hypothetical protein
LNEDQRFSYDIKIILKVVANHHHVNIYHRLIRCVLTNYFRFTIKINNGRRYADKGVWGTKSVLFGVNSNLRKSLVFIQTFDISKKIYLLKDRKVNLLCTQLQIKFCHRNPHKKLKF